MPHFISNKIKLFFLISLILSISTGNLWAADGIEIQYLAKGKKVIPVICEIAHWRMMDIKLPDLVITNKKKKSLTIESVDIIGKISGAEAIRLKIAQSELLAAIKNTANSLNNKTVPLPGLQLSYGNLILPEGILSENNIVSRGQSVVLPLSKINYLHYVGLSRIDALQVDIKARINGKKKLLTFPVQLIPYESKGKYIFPLKGDLHMAYIPLSYIHHRGSASQEFAMDVVGANQKDAASFTDISRPNAKTLSDHSIWGRDVMAIGDGIVVDMGDKFPEALMSDPAKFNDPQYTPNLLKELIGKIGWPNAVAGNFVIIDHENGEFSIYCHLQDGSIKVKPGDKVHKGMIIARVGNTGNSSAPHLHFQIMDSKNFFTANGLPMMFENVPTSAIIIEYPTKANTLSFSDNLFYTLP